MLETAATNLRHTRAHDLRIMCLFYMKGCYFMQSFPEIDEKNIEKLHTMIMDGLQEIDPENNWLAEYKIWKAEHDFEGILFMKDPFNKDCAGDVMLLDHSDGGCMRDLDVMCMAAFLSDYLHQITIDVFNKIQIERNSDNKIEIIDSYLNTLDQIVKSKKLSYCIVQLNDFAEKQMVLKGKKPVDFYMSFYSLRELLRKRSSESLFLLLTKWRITGAKRDLKELLACVSDYIQAYFYEYDKDPDMHLFQSMDGLVSARKLEIIVGWLERVALHTSNIVQKYKDLGWIMPIDRLADNIIATNQISKYEMLSLNYSR